MDYPAFCSRSTTATIISRRALLLFPDLLDINKREENQISHALSARKNLEVSWTSAALGKQPDVATMVARYQGLGPVVDDELHVQQHVS